MRNNELRTRCQALVATLDLPRPFDVVELGRRISARRNRPIKLWPRSMMGLPSGLTLPYRYSDVVFYEKNTTAVHQAVIILHEYAHILLGHIDAPNFGDIAEILNELHPSLISLVLGDKEIVGQVVARTHYSSPKEREAELLASLIHQAATRPPVLRPRNSDHDTLVDRVGRTLEPRGHRDG